MKFFLTISIIMLMILTSCKEQDITQKDVNYLIDLDCKSYDKLINKKGDLIVVGFFRDNDKMNEDFIRIMNRTAGTLKDSVVFAHLDIDKNYKFAKEKNIRCVPTYKFYRNGKILKSLNGTLDSLQLDMVISDLNPPQVKVEPENLYAND